MTQSTLDDEDDLFGEAANEMRTDVEESLDAARASLPDADDVWTAEADNVLGVLNGLRSALDVGDAREKLRDAKKWFTMGKRADAFEDADDLETAIEDIEETIETVEAAHEQVGELTSTVPELRTTLDELGEAGGDENGDASEDAEESDEAAAEADD